MRRFVGRAIRRVFHTGLADVNQNLIETKSGISATQQQLGETDSHVLALRREVSELKQALERVAREASFSEICRLPRRLDEMAMKHISGRDASADQIGECRAIATHYARSADLVSRHWIAQAQLPRDPFPDDDLTLDHAMRTNAYVPGSEVDVDPQRPGLPWRHLFSDPDCGVFIVLGQSNAGNHGDTPYAARKDVYSLDFLRMRCDRASDPLAGASGTGGSVWSRLGETS